MQYPNLEEEKKLWKKGYECVVGLDEVGRGPLAGPVVAGAVFIKSPSTSSGQAALKILIKGINDSKKISEKKREEIFDILVKHKDVKWGIGIVSEKEIDKINILKATKLAMKKAVTALTLKMDGRPLLKSEVFLLIDGNFSVDFIVRHNQKAIIKGDQKVISISAASIIAKVTRDRLMKKFHKKFSQYGFDKHKGYGTAFHIEMIEKHGPCDIHRRSFAPISSLSIK